MFPERFKKLREEKGLTQLQAANAFGLSKNTIYSWESGDRRPDISLLPKIARFFNVTTDYLLGVDDSERRNTQQAFPPETQYAAHVDDDSKPVTEKRLHEILAKAFKDYEKRKNDLPKEKQKNDGVRIFRAGSVRSRDLDQ